MIANDRERLTDVRDGTRTDRHRHTASCNDTISLGANTSFGFQGTWTCDDSSPTDFTLNGATCTRPSTEPGPGRDQSSHSLTPARQAQGAPI